MLLVDFLKTFFHVFGIISAALNHLLWAKLNVMQFIAMYWKYTKSRSHVSGWCFEDRIRVPYIRETTNVEDSINQ